MRASRIPHPEGGRFLLVHAWSVRAVGRAGAAVLAVVDFLDRRENCPGRAVASRARILADVEGFVGRDAVDQALERLVALGWLVRHQRTAMGTANLLTFVDYGLDVSAIASFLSAEMSELPKLVAPELPHSGEPEIRNSVRKSGRLFGTRSTRGKQDTTDAVAKYVSIVLLKEASAFQDDLFAAAAYAKLTVTQAQILADALTGALRSTQSRPQKIKRWLEATANAIAASKFIEGEAYQQGRAARLVLKDQVLRQPDDAAHKVRLEQSAAAVQRLIAARKVTA